MDRVTGIDTRAGTTVRLLVSLLLPLLAGAIGGFATSQGVTEWYPTLVKPPFNPPSWIFGPVWTLLYVLMGIALFLVWQKGADSRGVTKAMAFFGVQLALNALWSVLFFGARAPGWALLDLIFLWLFLLIALRLFSGLDRRAGWLLAPYLAWVTFAGVLNFSIWHLN